MLKVVEEHLEDLSYLRVPLCDPIREEENDTPNNECKTYYYGKRISMLRMICMAC
jgi:hypothetical protein